MAKHVYTLRALPPQERVRALAYQRSALNVGFTAGAGISGVALAIGTRSAYLVLVLATGMVLLVTAVVIARLPAVPGKAAERGNPFAVLADRPFVALSGLCGMLQSHQTLFTVVLPLWIVTATDAPAVLVPVIFVINTVMAVDPAGARQPGQRDPARRRDRPADLRHRPRPDAHGRRADTVGGSVGVSATVPPDDRRGEYLGAFRLGGQLRLTLTPAGLTFLAVGTGGRGVRAEDGRMGGTHRTARLGW